VKHVLPKRQCKDLKIRGFKKQRAHALTQANSEATCLRLVNSCWIQNMIFPSSGSQTKRCSMCRTTKCTPQ